MRRNDPEMESLRKELVSAQKYYALVDIARETGIPPKSLSMFLSVGSLGADKRRALRAWLDEHKFDDKRTAAAKLGEQASLFSLLAGELRALADVLASPEYSDEAKVARFCSWVRIAHGDLDQISKRFKKAKD